MEVYRRRLLKVICCIPFIGFAKADLSTLGRQNISHLKVSVPLWLFNEKSKGNVLALSITKTDETNFVIEFSGGRKLTLKGNTSVASIEKSNENKPSKHSILLKRTLSYTLQEIYKDIANKRHIEKAGGLRQQFDDLQREENINCITVGSMYNLISRLSSLSSVLSISWNPAEKDFILH